MLHHFGPLTLMVGFSHPHAEPSRNAGAVDLRALFVDHELADGVYYAYRFYRDGTFAGSALGKEIHGTWHVSGNEFCWMQRTFTAVEECFEVERQGKEIRFLRDGYQAFAGTSSPINAAVPLRESR